MSTETDIKDLLYAIESSITDALNPSTAAPDILTAVESAVTAQFDSQGADNWSPLAPSTIKDRKRKGFAGQPILERTGALRQFITEQATVLENNGNSITIGYQDGPETTIADILQDGTSKMPARTIIAVTDDLENQVVDAIAAHAFDEIDKSFNS